MLSRIKWSNVQRERTIIQVDSYKNATLSFNYKSCIGAYTGFAQTLLGCVFGKEENTSMFVLYVRYSHVYAHH